MSEDQGDLKKELEQANERAAKWEELARHRQDLIDLLMNEERNRLERERRKKEGRWGFW
jgi:hypothetical protein